MPSSPSDEIIALYENHAETWQRMRASQKLIERDWLTAFLNALPAEGSEILDLGCGSGVPIARHLIDNGCKVTGVDGAKALVTQARKEFPDHRWITADMRKLPALGRFHGIIAWHSFFHLTPEDQRPMFAAFQRLAAPGAALMFTSGKAHGEAIGHFEGRALYHGSLGSSEYRELLHESGFRVLRHVEEDASCGGATVWLAKCDVEDL